MAYTLKLQIVLELGILPKLRFTPTQKPCFEVSCKVTYRIAQKTKSRITVTLGKPCDLDIVALVYGKDQRTKLLGTTNALNVFEMLTFFLSKMQKIRLGSICTNGAPVMPGDSCCFDEEIKKLSQEMESVHEVLLFTTRSRVVL